LREEELHEALEAREGVGGVSVGLIEEEEVPRLSSSSGWRAGRAWTPPLPKKRSSKREKVVRTHRHRLRAG